MRKSTADGRFHIPTTQPFILRFSARSQTKERLATMSREIAGLVLAGPPGVTVFGGRPSISPAFGYWPSLIDRRKVNARLTFDGQTDEISCDQGDCGIPEPEDKQTVEASARSTSLKKVPLSLIAHARSGDKGDMVNIGVAALRPELYPEILREVTVERLAEFFKSTIKGPIHRYRLDNLNAVNFVCHGALDGGGTVSLLLDNQGKTLAQALLTMEVDINAHSL